MKAIAVWLAGIAGSWAACLGLLPRPWRRVTSLIVLAAFQIGGTAAVMAYIRPSAAEAEAFVGRTICALVPATRTLANCGPAVPGGPPVPGE